MEQFRELSFKVEFKVEVGACMELPTVVIDKNNPHSSYMILCLTYGGEERTGSEALFYRAIAIRLYA